ncbi:type II secretion system protein N [Limnobacter humi]|uniref:Type II secretion system protein N n=1 Tax=Limnobacter humi TaxID=1778671 RepID=A0ABT1WJE8_9BURK|nr:type II secretion system protein N [Limnobacter humi]MCQ8897633.1 type II secretion system protein N [Limnobacter humi]
MSRARQWLLPTLAALAVAVVAWPAYSLKSRLESIMGPTLSVLAMDGSLWNGAVQLGVSDGGQVYAVPGVLAWHTRLGEGGLQVTLTHPRIAQALHLAVGLNGIRVEDGALQFPASWLMALGAPYNTIRPEGLIQVRWQGWQAGQALDVRVTWSDAQSALASIRPLGEYVITVTGNPGKQLDVNLNTLRGPLMMEGQGAVVPGQRFSFTGYAQAQEASREALTGLLSQMGRLEGQRYRLGVF